jgi:hypothetical protein
MNYPAASSGVSAEIHRKRRKRRGIRPATNKMNKLPIFLIKNRKSQKGQGGLVRLGLLGLLVALFMISACESDPDPCRKTEISRKISPDKQLAAIIQTHDCGKFTSMEYQVLITSADPQKRALGYVLLADQVEHLELKWLNQRQLEISYQKARIFRFTNIWRWEINPDKAATVVEIKLRQTSQGSALTPKARGEGEQGG